MDTTAKLNEFQCARSAKIVGARLVLSYQIPGIENGHSRSVPAEIDGTLMSPRFRSGKASELPVGIRGSFISSEPVSEPIVDPTLATASLAE
jgi:hypothetical protein